MAVIMLAAFSSAVGSPWPRLPSPPTLGSLSFALNQTQLHLLPSFPTMAQPREGHHGLSRRWCTCGPVFESSRRVRGTSRQKRMSAIRKDVLEFGCSEGRLGGALAWHGYELGGKVKEKNPREMTLRTVCWKAVDMYLRSTQGT